MIRKKASLHVLADMVLFVLLPVISAIAEKAIKPGSLSWMLFGKWFVFWAFGFRLFIAGIKQASDPSLSAKRHNNEIFEMVRGLGITNICLGVGGILSLINETWRQVIAILGCLFFGLNTISCFTGGLTALNQKLTALFSLLVFIILLLYVLKVLMVSVEVL